MLRTLQLGAVTTPSHQGAALGLPEDGPGAVAPLGRRAVALLVDWALCQLIAMSFFGMEWGQVSGAGAFVPLGLLLLANLLLVPTIGTTVGHRLLGLRVVAVDGDGTQPPGLVHAAYRAVLLCLFVPALIMDADTRGLHDKAARSVVVRTR
ncbi:RDD family protein [Ornithinimicrobium cerasi]|uniref:RDD family protein n=1 Tax=Ornithinimicrobium cerasi TaxID=2248773 RepID=A0A285VH04_9MICO|nr:RDD family protein [Ornithinimicrobium cerasi]